MLFKNILELENESSYFTTNVFSVAGVYWTYFFSRYYEAKYTKKQPNQWIYGSLFFRLIENKKAQYWGNKKLTKL